VDEALELLEPSLKVSRSVNDQEAMARSLTRLADAHLRKGQLDAADSAAREAETVARKWGYRKGHADSLVVRSGIAQAQGDAAMADHYLKDAQKLYTILHDPMATQLAQAAGEK
jgi:ATP/maltotriose-dependent transcriptional regulator MalT